MIRTFHHNLQKWFQRALALKAGYQLSEGINLEHVTNVMSIQSESSVLNEIRMNDTRARSNTF